MGAPSETKLAEASNVGGTRNVLELMKELGIKKVSLEVKSTAENSGWWLADRPGCVIVSCMMSDTQAM